MSEQADSPENGKGEARNKKKMDTDRSDDSKHKNGARRFNFNIEKPKSIKRFLMLVTMSVIALIMLVLIMLRIN